MKSTFSYKRISGLDGCDGADDPQDDRLIIRRASFVSHGKAVLAWMGLLVASVRILAPEPPKATPIEWAVRIAGSEIGRHGDSRINKSFQVNLFRRLVSYMAVFCTSACALGELVVTDSPKTGDFVLFDGSDTACLIVETNSDHAVLRATQDLAEDFARVTGIKPRVKNQIKQGIKLPVIVGTLGDNELIDQLAKDGKLSTNGIAGQWESYLLQVVKRPMPGVDCALVIAGSDRRGTIYGIYQLSEMIGVSPWYWWADVPVKKQLLLALHGDMFKQGPPAVKYRGIFLNDEDWGLRPWATKTFEPETGNIGPKTYAKVFELLLRLRANYLWPAMHPGTTAFNSFPENAKLANEYGIVMGSSHCEQMLRNNVSEWDEKQFGEYDFAHNPGGVLKYWEQRVRENGKFENIYTLGMRGIHDGGMPGGGTVQEKSERLHQIIQDQREMLSRLVNTNLDQVPQIFCPYKEVLELYRFAPDIPEDITIVWPDDNYGYIRQFSNPRERARSGGAGVNYHVSYWGSPRDYLWLCSTPPALIAEEMTKAYYYGADKVWMLNVGDLKPAELDIEFFLKLAWQPNEWNGTNTDTLFGQQIARDFGLVRAPEITSIMAEYYRLNFQRKPEHMNFPTNSLFNVDEAAERLAAWKRLLQRVDDIEKILPSEFQDAYFELVGYPVKAASAMNEKCLAASPQAADEIHRLTDIYNSQIAGGKWRHLMSDNPRGQVDLGIPKITATKPAATTVNAATTPRANPSGADFAERDHLVVMEAAHASAFVPGKDARWSKIIGLGYMEKRFRFFRPPQRFVPSRTEFCLSRHDWNIELIFKRLAIGRSPFASCQPFQLKPADLCVIAISIDDSPPIIITLPVTGGENDPQWQANVLRNAALSSSVLTVPTIGMHTLKIWMV